MYETTVEKSMPFDYFDLPSKATVLTAYDKDSDYVLDIGECIGEASSIVVVDDKEIKVKEYSALVYEMQLDSVIFAKK